MHFPTIKHPCLENWEGMTPTAQGRFCKACQKQVVDFSQQSREDVLLYLLKHTHEQVCGRVLSSQLLPDLIQQPTVNPPQYTRFKVTNMAFYLLFAGALLLHSCGTETPSSQTTTVYKMERYQCTTDTVDMKVAYKNNKHNVQIVSGKFTSPKQQPEDTLYSYVQVDHMPQFPGGADSLKAYLRSHIPRYITVFGVGESELLLVKLTINRYGMIENAKLLSGATDTELNNNVIKALQQMPAWTAATHNGCPVDVVCYLPIRLRL